MESLKEILDDNKVEYNETEVALSLSEVHLVDMGDKIPVHIEKCFPIEVERLKIYQAEEASLKEGFVCSGQALNEETKQVEEHVLHIKNNNIVSIQRCDGILMEEFPITKMVEYRFSADDTWKISKLGVEALDQYRALKFKTWLEMITSPDCEAQFRRLLKTGLVCTMFDHTAFKTPAADLEKYQVQDDKTGKTVNIPHPVYELRSWDPKQRAYVKQDTRLVGAPKPEDEDKYWENLLDQLRGVHGKEYVDQLIEK